MNAIPAREISHKGGQRDRETIPKEDRKTLARCSICPTRATGAKERVERLFRKSWTPSVARHSATDSLLHTCQADACE